MKIGKIRDVKTPNRAHSTDAGIDFYLPKLTPEFVSMLKSKNQKSGIWVDTVDNRNRLIIPSHDTVLIPSGIKMKVPANHALVFFNKSGISAKEGLIIGACVIDDGYEGEVHINLLNPSKTPGYIYEDQKTVQGLLLKLNFENIEEVQLEDLYDKKSERGETGFGDSDNTKM